ENLRRGIPPLQVGGAMYSEDPGKRMVVLNGQVFHEGDRPVPELTLEQIRLKSAVFSLPGGQRFVLNYWARITVPAPVVSASVPPRLRGRRRSPDQWPVLVALAPSRLPRCGWCPRPKRLARPDAGEL